MVQVGRGLVLAFLVFAITACGGRDGQSAVTTAASSVATATTTAAVTDRSTIAPAPPEDPDDAAASFLALGDSYTIGQSVDLEERWPIQLVALFRDAGQRIADPEFIARTGWTTADLVGGIDAASPEGPYGLVSLQIGVNNQFGGGDIGTFRAEFVALLNRAIGLAGGEPARVLVLSIPDWGVTPFAPDGLRERISDEIDDFNEVIVQESNAATVRLVDVTPSSRRAASDPALLAADDLHPSGLMYAEWAALAFAEALAALGR